MQCEREEHKFEFHNIEFEAIYREYQNLMYYTANRILGDTRDSEDIVHQAFLKIIDIIERIDEVKCPKTKGLIVTITERTAIDLYRSRKRRSVVSFDEEFINTPAETDIEKFDRRDMLAGSIAALPVRYREILLLRYDNGFSMPEIVTHVFHEITDYRFSAEIPGSQIETELGMISLGFIPHGMDKANEYGDESFYSVSYETEAGMYFDLTYTLITENQNAHKIVDTENAVVQEYSINGEETVIISKGENNTILWIHRNILFQLYGNLPLDIEKQIAESITVE